MNDELLEDLGPEPLVDEDDGNQLFDALDDAGYVEGAQGVAAIAKIPDIADEIQKTGEVSREQVEALDAAGMDISNESYPLASFTTLPSELNARHVIDSMESDRIAKTAKGLHTATGNFAKSVGSAFVKAKQVVSDMLDKSHGQKPAIDFSIRRIDALHEEIKNSIEERGGVPDGAAEILRAPADELTIEFIRDNIEHSMGAFVKRKAAASMVAALDGKRSAFEVEIITRPEVAQKTISEAADALKQLVKNINDNASLDGLRKNPGRVKEVQDSTVAAQRDLKTRLSGDDDYKVGQPEDYQNFGRVSETITGAITAIAKADLNGRPFDEMLSRIETLNRDVEKLAENPNEDNLSPEALAAWARLTKSVSVAVELYQGLVKAAIYVEDVADLFHRILMNARREMVRVAEIAAESADPMASKRLMLLAEREKESIIEGQDAMRNARRKAAERRATSE